MIIMNEQIFDKLDLKTPNFTNENVEKLAVLFPNCVTEKKNDKGKIKKAIDFDLLRQEFSENIVEGTQERYSLNWPGKRQALATANIPISKTLRPCREESVDFDTTKNIFIEGDNLEALKLLQETYLNKIKMIYIDPPYNTGKDFVYKDNFTASKDEYDLDSGHTDEEGGRLVANPDSNGRYHSDWLSMIYPRLKLARNLLKDDGAVAIHIDENEYSNLNQLLNEIFGEENNLGAVVWDKRNPKGKVGGVAQQHEYIFFFCKNKEAFNLSDYFYRKKENADLMLKKVEGFIRKNGGVNDAVRQDYKRWANDSKNNLSGGEKAYCLIDNNGDVFQTVSMAAPDKPETRSHRPLIHPLTENPCPVPEKGWRFTDKTMDELLLRDKISYGSDETSQPRQKYFLKENMKEAVPSLLYFGGSDNALGLPFDNPKPVSVAAKLIESVCLDGDLIIDFFAGSGTTAHSVMQLNAEDGGDRKCISVQLPEVTDEKSEAYKAGYKNIAEISKERIRRAGKKILEDNKAKEDIDKLDTGFRVFKIDSSNIKDVFLAPDQTKIDMFDDLSENIKDDRSAEDLLFGVLLDWGVDLSLPIECQQIDGKDVYFVDGNALAACFDKDINEEFVKKLAEKHPLRVVFRDSGFESSSVKINIDQIFKLKSPSTEIKVI